MDTINTPKSGMKELLTSKSTGRKGAVASVLGSKTGTISSLLKRNDEQTESNKKNSHAHRSTLLLPIGCVHNKEQSRKIFDLKKLDELAESISRDGLFSPILVYKKEGESDQYEICAGERRWRACKILQLEFIECLVIEKPEKDSDLLIIEISENEQRENLSIRESAEATRNLKNQLASEEDESAKREGRKSVKITNNDIAEVLKKSPSWVSMRLTIADMSKPVEDVVDEFGFIDAQLIVALEKLYTKDSAIFNGFVERIRSGEVDNIRKAAENALKEVKAIQKAKAESAKPLNIDNDTYSPDDDSQEALDTKRKKDVPVEQMKPDSESGNPPDLDDEDNIVVVGQNGSGSDSDHIDANDFDLEAFSDNYPDGYQPCARSSLQVAVRITGEDQEGFLVLDGVHSNSDMVWVRVSRHGANQYDLREVSAADITIVRSAKK